MARRHGRPGEYLSVDDYTGVTRYRSELQYDYWGNLVKRPLLRNLQEISSPMNDPQPVPDFRGQQYEQSNPSQYVVAPTYVGNTTVRTNLNNAAAQALDL